LRVCGLFWRLASTEICWLQHDRNTLRFLVELSEADARQTFPQSSRLRYQKRSERVLFAPLLIWAQGHAAFLGFGSGLVLFAAAAMEQIGWRRERADGKTDWQGKRWWVHG
jgi:hypothetical protein